jgi:regulatory protein
LSRTTDPYIAGLRLLAMREFSAARLADRLQRRGFAPDDVAEAIDRLRHDRALDDRRAAGSFADTFVQRGRGRRRVLRDLEAQGIEIDVAEEAVAETFSTIDERTHLDEVIARRLDRPLRDRAEFDRLHRFLVRRGFSSADVLAALKNRLAPPTSEDG